MKQYVFLCDKKWQVQQVLFSSDELVQPDVFLTDLILQPESLTENKDLEGQKVNTVSLQFRDHAHRIPAILCTYPQHYMVFLMDVRNQEDYKAFADSFTHFCSWAEDHLQQPFQDEYYQIQQMNNQLINSQRSIMKVNRQLKQALDEVRKANTTISLLERDELTEFYRAPAFYQRAEALLKKSQGESFDIIVLDIERFKLINETFGRKTGDTLLQNLALFLIGLENADKGIFARASADTFFIFMPENLHFYNFLQGKLSGFFKNYPLPIHVHEKLGVYTVNDDMEISVEQMCDRARLALDTAVFQDEGKITFYDQKLHDALILQHRILDSIPEALEKKQFQLYLQPKFNMLTDEVIGA